MNSKTLESKTFVGTVAILIIGFTLSACGSSTTAKGPSVSSNPRAYAGQTIHVVYSGPAPATLLKQFTKKTGIHVHWTNVQWDNLQTKITSASTAGVYFADVTDVDWSRIGQYYATKWFLPLNKYINVAKLKAQAPITKAFMDHGELIGVPYDSQFLVTTINTADFKKAGITTVPTTMAQYTSDLKKLQSTGVSPHPLDIPFQAAEGLSTYWYETTAAFGGHVLSASFKPLFTSPNSPGYRAMEWMVNAYKTGLVPPGNLDVLDVQGQEQEMAQNKVASIFSDYSGNVGYIYNNPQYSNQVNKIKYIPTPGVNGPGPNLGDPDGIGIPKTAKHVGAAVQFLKWWDNPTIQADVSGLDGSGNDVAGPPTDTKSWTMLEQKAGTYAQASTMAKLASNVQPVFPNGEPPWYAQFSNAVYTNIHSAAAGQETVKQAINTIASTVNSLRTGS